MMGNEVLDLVSVIIPVYNIEEYVGDCLASVCKQSYENMEIIIVDDGSYDNSSEICRRFASTDKRIKYVRQENGGLVRARKTGLLNVTGNYVIFVDGDDKVDEDYVSYLYDKITKYQVDYVHCNYKVDGINKKFFRNRYIYSSDDLTLSARKHIIFHHVFEWKREEEIFDCQIYASIYKKDLIIRCFDMVPDYQSYGEDLICFINLIMNCGSMAMLPDAHYNYTIRDGSLDHPKDIIVALKDKIALYTLLQVIVSEYRLGAKIEEKLYKFFVNKIISSICLAKYDDLNIIKSYFYKNIDGLKGKKILLYGAGCVGQGAYLRLCAYENIDIVAWVDRNYKKIVNPFRKIESPSILRCIEYDVVLITVNDEVVADGIVKELISLGVQRKKILWSYPDLEYVVRFEF